MRHERHAAWGNGVHSGIVAHYMLAHGTQEQRLRWLPRLASGELIAAVAMTEPGAGSDLKNISTGAVRDGGDDVIDGAKTFITDGHTADLIVAVARTDPAAGAHGTSLLMVEARDCPVFVHGRILDKVGQHGADTHHRSLPPAVRRLRLHARVPHLAHVCRLGRAEDLRRANEIMKDLVARSLR